MKVIQSTEIEQAIKDYNKLIHEYRAKDVEYQNTTKADFIKRLIEKTDYLIKVGAYPNLKRNDIASFLYSELQKNEIDISYRHVVRYCSSDQKRNYDSSAIMSLSHKHEFLEEVDGGILGVLYKCECNKLSNGTQEIEFKTLENEDKEREKQERKVELKLDETDELILLRVDNANSNGKLWYKIFESRHDDPDIKRRIDECLDLDNKKSIKELTDDEKGIQAKYETFESFMDMREKLHLAEILRLNMLIYDYNLAKVASLLDLSAKWLHAVEKRMKDGKNTEELLDMVKEIHGCPACKWAGFSMWMEENKNRIERNLEVIQPERRELLCISCKRSNK